MNTTVFEELLRNAKSRTLIAGLRKLILDAALRGEFDAPAEHQIQLCDALKKIQSSPTKNQRNRGRKRQPSAKTEKVENISIYSGSDLFVVNLGDIAAIEKGKTGIKDVKSGEYPLVVTAEGRLSADHFDFEGPAVIIPLVSSTGHGDASLKRIHYQDGKYAVGSILCVVQSRYPDLVHPRYLYEYLSIFKDELLVARMSGTANVSLTVKSLDDVPVPLITFDAQTKLERLMYLCDALEAKGQLEATQHAQLLSTLLGTLTASATPEELANNWQRVAQHFDLLLDRPKAIDALEQTLLQLAVRGLLVPQDPTDEPASVLLQKIRAEKDRLIAAGQIKKDKPLLPVTDEEKPFELPVGWEWVRMGALIELVSGQHLGPHEYIEGLDADIPYLTGPAEFGQVSPAPTRSTRERRAVAVNNDILITVKGSGVGKLNVVSQAEIAISRQLMAIRPIATDAEFLMLFLQTMALYFQSKSVGIAIPGIGREDVTHAVLGLPSYAEQSRIVTRVTQLRRLCADLRQRLAEREAVQARLAEALVASVA